MGGILDQVIDGVNGMLIDPADLAAFGREVSRVLIAPALAERLGRAAHERVRDAFLAPRHLRQWIVLIEALPAATAAARGAAPRRGRWSNRSGRAIAGLLRRLALGVASVLRGTPARS